MLKKLSQFICILTLAITTTIPLTGCGSALTREQEIALGEHHGPRFLKEGGGKLPDATVNAYVTSIGRKIVTQIQSEERKSLPWEFHVLNSKILNAFALPGGKVFISRGLLEKLKNEAELAGVLGHEVGHVVGEHIGKQMQKQALVQTGLSVLGAATESGWAEILGGVGGNLYLLKFGRGQESESDAYGVKYLISAGYDPRGMLGVIQVLRDAAAGGGNLEILSTHPDPARRFADTERLIMTQYSGALNNPKFVLNESAFRVNVLDRLKNIPAPKK